MGFGSTISSPSGVLAEPRPLNDFSVVWGLQADPSGTLLKINSCRRLSIWQQGRLRQPPSLGARNYMSTGVINCSMGGSTLLNHRSTCTLVAPFLSDTGHGKVTVMANLGSEPGPSLQEITARHCMHFFIRTLHGTQTIRWPHGRKTTSAWASEQTMHSASAQSLPLHNDDAVNSQPLLHINDNKLVNYIRAFRNASLPASARTPA